MIFFAKSDFIHSLKLGLAVSLLLFINSVSLHAGFDVHLIESDSIHKIKKSMPKSSSHTQIGNFLFVRSSENDKEVYKKLNKAYPSDTFKISSDEKLYLITTKDPAVLRADFPMTKTLFKKSGFIVLSANETAAMNLYSYKSNFTNVEPFIWGKVLMTAPKISTQTRIKTNDKISNFLEKLDMKTYMKNLSDIVDFKTRYTPTDSANKSLEHCQKLFEALGYPVTHQYYDVYGKKTYNLVAEFKGEDEQTHGEILVTGHLDSISPTPQKLAPGADDNGSGSAGVIALAKLLKDSALKPKATIKFVLFMGEEQGLYGSKAYLKAITPEEKKKIRLVLNMDMIAFDKQPPLSMMLETSSAFKNQAARLENLALNYSAMSVQISYNPYGSDHLPFIKQSVPAFLSIQSEFDSNPNYHQLSDTMAIINEDLCKNILRLNGAAMYVFGIFPEK